MTKNTPNKKISASADYSDIKPVWLTQRSLAFAKINQIPSTGDPNSQFNKRVNERTEAKQQQPKRQRPRHPDGRPYSSTRITAMQARGASR